MPDTGWDGGAQTVTAAHGAPYAAATGDLASVYDGPDAIAPPMFHTRLLKSTTEKATGLLAIVELACDAGGDRAVTCETACFVRGPSDRNAPSRRERPAPDFQVTVQVPGDASHRYAVASLDDNPLHVDPVTAHRAGFDALVLQGLCTMALTGDAVTREVAGGDPGRLGQLAVRFSRPVRNGAVLTVRGWDLGSGSWALETLGSDGKPVITAATARFRN